MASARVSLLSFVSVMQTFYSLLHTTCSGCTVHILLSNCVLLGVAVLATAFHLARDHLSHYLSRADNSSSEPYEIAKSPNDPGRAQAIEVKRQNFLYGPSPAVPIPFFPASLLGNATVLKDIADDLGPFLA